MLNIFIAMCVGVAIGYLTRSVRHPRLVAGRINTVTIAALMLLLGSDVGDNDYVLDNLATIGFASLLLATGALFGTALAAKALWKYSFRHVAPQAAIERPEIRAGSAQSQDSRLFNTFSLMVVGSFIAGLALGIFTDIGSMAKSAGLAGYVLYLMMFCVGLTIGSDTATLRSIVKQPRRTVLVPLATIFGTWIGVSAMWVVVKWLTDVDLSFFNSMALGSAFGYYSLSTVLIGKISGAEVATICLLTNILRELVAVTAAPWIANKFSPLGLICVGGATTVDVTLPVIIRCCGTHYVALAVFQGVIIDLSVPFLVTFFAGLAA